jgi:hypothetical protein
MMVIYMQITIDYLFTLDTDIPVKIATVHGTPDINTIVGSNGDVIKYYKFGKKSSTKKSTKNT